MTNTTITTEELAMKVMIAELKIMNLKLDILEQEIDDREKEMDGLNKGINKSKPAKLMPDVLLTIYSNQILNPTFL